MSPPNFLLVGPPHLRDLPPSSTASGVVDPFTDLMNTSFNVPSSPVTDMRRLLVRQIRSPALISSGNACLDFFFHVVPDTDPETLTGLLSKAWIQDPLTALKLVCHLRGVRGTGKSDREGFYDAALWLHLHHPKTLALNVSTFAQFGYMKDLLEILHRILEGPDTRKALKEERKRAKTSQGMKRVGHGLFGFQAAPVRKPLFPRRKVKGTAETLNVETEKSAKARLVKRAELARRAIERYNTDRVYQFLYDKVSEFFAGMLLSDLKMLKSGLLHQIGPAAKWCPSLNSSYDRSTLLCESIARRMWPKEHVEEYMEIEDEHYAFRVRDRLRRVVLVPIRKVLELPEVYMSAGKWDSVPYHRITSVAMKNYSKIFKQHDEERFAGYLEEAKEGKNRIAAGDLLPHEILASASDVETRDVAELQWNRMVDDMLGTGKLKNCIAVCNVSGSMHGTPMEVCVALGLLISELSEEPWKGRVITFSESPRLHLIKGEKLADKMSFVQNMEFGRNTDFQKVFDRILEVARNGKVGEDKMIKRVFVFSDMEFDQASANNWETDYMAICRKFQESGYGSCVPEIVFWNLRVSRSMPVQSTQKGVALVSGFSKNMMKVFLEGEEVIDPVDVMNDAISGAEYQKLVVFD